jgi:hypothetical protein
MYFQAKYILKNNYYYIFNNEKVQRSLGLIHFFGEEQSIKILISHIKPNPTTK